LTVCTQTHGVTQYSSGLVYHGESGALNEAISDVFGALVDRQEGATDKNIWLVGENTARNGYIRDMSDPKSRRHFDFYPTRYQGPLDMGGVHWNSGIVNLAFKLLVMGGTHPRQKTSVHVRGLVDIFQGNEDEAFQTAGDIFFCANNECLTPTSTFEDARFCTTIICGATGRRQDEEVVHCVQSAWFAVGVGSEPSPPRS
jgi:bacillolysin